jgi:hypothetical protein
MIEMTLEELESRIQAVEMSYERQLNLSGKAGYDHSLTLALKKDLDFLHEQRSHISDRRTVQENC